MPTIAEIRAQFPSTQGKTDLQIVEAYSQSLGQSMDTIAYELGVALPKIGGNTGAAWESGKAGYKAGFGNIAAAVGEKIGARGLQKYGENLRDDMSITQQYADSKNTDPTSFSDVNSLGDFGGYVRSGAVKSAPYLAEAIAFAAADGITGGALTPAILETYATRAAARYGAAGIEKQVLASGASNLATQAAAREAATQSAGRGLARTAMMPVVTAPSSLGDVLGNQYEEAGKYDLGSALPAAAGYAALNAIGLEGALARGMPVSVLGSRVGRAASGATKLGVQGAAQETAQEVMNQAARMGVNPDATLTSGDALERYKESAILGGILEGAPAAVTGAFSKSPSAKSADTAARLSSNQDLDLLDASQEDRTRFPADPKYVREIIADATIPGEPVQQVIDAVNGIDEPRPSQAGTREAFKAKLQNPVVLPDETGKAFTTTDAYHQYLYDNNIPIPADKTLNYVDKTVAPVAETPAAPAATLSEDGTLNTNFVSTLPGLGKVASNTRKWIEANAAGKTPQEFIEAVGSQDLTEARGRVFEAVLAAFPQDQSIPAAAPAVQSTALAEPVVANSGIDFAKISASLAPQQKKIFDVLVSASQNFEMDDIVSGDGTLQYQNIAEKAGLRNRGAAQSAINQTLKKISALAGVDVKQFLADRTKSVRSIEASGIDSIGLSPAKQASVVGNADVFGNEEESIDPSMGVIKSVGATDTDMSSITSNNNRAQDAVMNKGTELLNEAGALDRGNVIVEDGGVEPSENAQAAAAANRRAYYRDMLTHQLAPQAGLEFNDYKADNAPNFEQYGLTAQGDFISEFVEIMEQAEESEWDSYQTGSEIEKAVAQFIREKEDNYGQDTSIATEMDRLGDGKGQGKDTPKISSPISQSREADNGRNGTVQPESETGRSKLSLKAKTEKAVDAEVVEKPAPSTATAPKVTGVPLIDALTKLSKDAKHGATARSYLADAKQGQDVETEAQAWVEAIEADSAPAKPKTVKTKTVLTPKEVASKVDLSQDITSTIEEVLAVEEQVRVEKHYNQNADEAFASFQEDFADWVFAGAKDVSHKLADLFAKVLKAMQQGVMSFAVMVNLNPVALPNLASLDVPVSTFTVKQVVERPKADFGTVNAPASVKLVADWQRREAPNKPVIIVDKQGGVAYVLDASGKLVAKTPALTGKAVGDIETEAAKTKELDDLKDSDKITPAGVFQASRLVSDEYGEVVKVTGNDKFIIAIHRTYLDTPAEMREARLASPTSTDNRVSFGCINVPASFYDNIIVNTAPSTGTFPVVILPETTNVESFFPNVDFSATETITTEVTDFGSNEEFVNEAFAPNAAKEENSDGTGGQNLAVVIGAMIASRSRNTNATLSGPSTRNVEINKQKYLAAKMSTKAHPEVWDHLKSMFALGYTEALKQLDGVYILPSNADMDGAVNYNASTGTYSLYLNEDIISGKTALQDYVTLERTIFHEVAHVLDDVAHDQLYSSDYILSDKGAVGKELATKFVTNDWVKKTFMYPMDAYYGLSGLELQSELFPQIMSAYHNPKLRPGLKANLPMTYLYAEIIHEEILSASRNEKTNNGRTGETQSGSQGQSKTTGQGRTDGGQVYATRQENDPVASKAGNKMYATSSAAARQVAGRSGQIAYDDTVHGLKKAFRGLVFLHDLVDEYKGRLPAIKDWYAAVQNSLSTRKQLEGDAEQIANEANNLKNGTDAVNAFISASTYEQKWGYDPQVAGMKVVVDPAMRAKFLRLSLEEQKVVKDVFAHGRKMTAAKQAILKGLSISQEFTSTGVLEGPYAPLKRFGNFLAVLKSKELRAAELADDKKIVEKLKASPEHYIVSAFDSIGQANQFARANDVTNGGKFAMTDAFEKSTRVNEGQVMPPAVLAKVLAAVKVDENVPAIAREAMTKLVTDMYFQTLDEQNARTSGMKRLNRAGYDADMIRSFLSHARAEAGFLANMKFGGEINTQFYKMQTAAKNQATGKRVAQDEFNAIAEHYAESLKYTETPWQDRAMALTSAWQLATSVGYHLTNALQGIMVTIPKLGADFNNYSGAWDHLMRGYSMLKTTGIYGAPNLAAIKDTNIRDMLQNASDMGVLDVGMDEDLTHFEAMKTGISPVDNTTAFARNALHRLRKVSRAVETANRISSAVAGYTMSIEAGKSVADAKEYAIRILQTTQGDFSRIGAPLLLKKLPKIVTQYRKYQFMMGALYVKAFRDAFYGVDANTKAIGRRMLAYKLFHTSVAAGALGMPLANLVGIAFAALGSDDEPKDIERSLRDLIGDDDLATLLLHGPLALMGLDMSGKLGDDKIFSIMPYGEWDLTSKTGVAQTAMSLAGPSASQFGKFADGLGLVVDGDYYKGLEKFMPKGVESGMKAFRVANEGYTLRNGDVLFEADGINGFALVMDSLGIPSSELKKMDFIRSQQYEISAFYKDRTSEIQHEYNKAYKDKDVETMKELRLEWLALQKGKDKVRGYFNNSRDAIKRQPLSNLLRYPQAVEKRNRKQEGQAPETDG